LYFQIASGIIAEDELISYIKQKASGKVINSWSIQIDENATFKRFTEFKLKKEYFEETISTARKLLEGKYTETSSCCIPHPDENIFGILSKDKKKLLIHQSNCNGNNQNIDFPVISLKWLAVKIIALNTNLKISGFINKSLLCEITNLINRNYQIHLQSIFHEIKEDRFNCRLDVFFPDDEILEHFIMDLKKIKGVKSVIKIAK
jgi:(p)ppGpp synthase/HD superfamily hydrolase